MSDEVASTGRPAYARYTWSDENSIYLEVPGQHGPCIIAYPLNEGGLSKALALMRDARKKSDPNVYVRPGVVAGYKPKGNFDEAQRERAREILKKLRITG